MANLTTCRMSSCHQVISSSWATIATIPPTAACLSAPAASECCLSRIWLAASTQSSAHGISPSQAGRSRIGRRVSGCRAFLPRYTERLAHDARNATWLMPRPCNLVLQVAARAGTNVALPHVGPRTAFIVSLARGLAGGAGGIGGHVQIAVVAPEPVDGVLHWAFARLDHTGTADTGDTTVVLDPWRYLAFQPARRRRVRGPRVGKTPGRTARVAFAARRANSRIAVADLETQIVAADAVGSALGLRLISEREHGECERGPYDRCSHCACDQP